MRTYTKQQHDELIARVEIRLIRAENLLREYNELTRNLNPDFPIPANGGKMVELISLSEKTQQFIN